MAAPGMYDLPCMLTKPSNSTDAITGTGARAFLVTVIGLILLAVGSHFESLDRPPLSKWSIVLFWILGGTGLLCVLAGLVLGTRAAVVAIRSKAVRSEKHRQTVRDYIRRRVRLGLVTALAIGVIAANLVNAFARNVHYQGLIVIAVLVIPFIAVYWTIRCPRCSTRLPRSVANRIDTTVLSKPLRHCPYCGVDLDEQMLKVNS